MKDQVTIIDLNINILKHDSTKKRVELLLNVSGLQAALNVPTMGNKQTKFSTKQVILIPELWDHFGKTLRQDHDSQKYVFCQGEKIVNGLCFQTTIVYVDRLSTSRSVYFDRVKKIGHDSLGPETMTLIFVVRLILLKRAFILKNQWRPALDYLICVFLQKEKNQPWQYRAGEFDILFHVVRLILLKRAFGLKDRWRPAFDYFEVCIL